MLGIGVLRALQTKYQAQVDMAVANLDIFVYSSVGIGEHGDIVDEVDKLVGILTDASDKLLTINQLMKNYGIPSKSVQNDLPFDN